MAIRSFSLPAMADLGIRTKLWLVILILTVPMVALLLMQFRARQGDISFAESESNGLDYVTAVNTFLEDVQLHRGLAQRVLAGDAGSSAAFRSAAASAEEHLNALTSLDKEFGGEFGTRDAVAAIRTRWDAIKETPAGQGAQANSDAHTQLIQENILPLMGHVANTSNLVLDPQLDSRSVIVALTESLPRMTEALALARDYGAGAMITNDGTAPADQQKLFMANQFARADSAAGDMGRNLQTAMATNKSFRDALSQDLDRHTIARTNFISRANTDITSAQTLSKASTEGFFTLGLSAIDSSNKLLDAAQVGLKSDFDGRRGSAQRALYLSGLAALVGIAAAIVFAFLIARSITKPIARLAEVADRMSLGELDIDIDVQGSNEVGQLAESLRRMQASLRSAIERLRMRRAA